MSAKQQPPNSGRTIPFQSCPTPTPVPSTVSRLPNSYKQLSPSKQNIDTHVFLSFLPLSHQLNDDEDQSIPDFRVNHMRPEIVKALDRFFFFLFCLQSVVIHKIMY